MAIDLVATKQNIKDKYGNINKFRRTTPFEYVSIIRFLETGIGVRASQCPDSVGHKIARWLQADGLLAEKPDSNL